jgi:hypothetical protein
LANRTFPEEVIPTGGIMGLRLTRVMKNAFCVQPPLSMEAPPVPFVIPSSKLACGKSREKRHLQSRWMQGPEGRPQNVSPARKGWETIQKMIRAP